MEHQVLFPLPDVPSPNLFLSLAPELKQYIFSALSNANNLKSLVLTCSSFYHTFLDAEHLIIKSILNTQIGPDLLCDAITVFESRTLEPDDGDAAIATLRLYAKQNPTFLSQKLTLRDALAIGGLHDNIVSFSMGFASLALSTNPVTGLDDATPSPLSVLEFNRIKRTFYRYELFCSMFRDSRSFQFVGAAGESPQKLFFSVCSPWKNEQLSCIRDYLHEQLSLPFDDVAKHDIEWGWLEVDYLDCGLDWRYNCWKETHLSFGLGYLRSVIDASTYDDRCKILKANRDGGSCSLYDALTKQGHGDGLPDLEGYTVEDERAHIPVQLAIDSDEGPKDAWRWAYEDYAVEQWYNASELGFLRQRGYVMWDSARLSQWGLLDHDWQDLPRESVSSEEDDRRGREMRESFEARQKIWSRGGRGWWSPADESRIVWPPPGPPKRPRTMASKRCWGNPNVWATDMETWRENL